jgi:D-methionine transport system permease protein
MQQELIKALYETLLMVFISGILTLLIGLPLGVLLNFTKPSQIFARPKLNTILRNILHSTQSVPYVILMIILMPVTSYILNNEEGWLVAILPLSLATIPFLAHQCDEVLNAVPKSLLELSAFYGASPFKIIMKVLLPETWPKLAQAFTKTLIQLTSFSAIAGLLGASGLGSLAIQKGYPEFQAKYVIATAILFICVIQLFQSVGNLIAKKAVLKNPIA